MGGCSYCDTVYAQDGAGGKELSVEEVVDKVSKLAPYYKQWICITGGEPLLQEEELHRLVKKLKEGGYRTTIETNGSFYPPFWYTLADSWNTDIKCPTSGVCGVSKEEWFKTRFCDQIKFVVGTKEDLAFVDKMLSRHKADIPIVEISPIITSPSQFVTPFLQEIAEFCKEHRVRLSIQLHKIVWGNKKGV